MKGIVVVGVVWASVDSMHVQGPTDAVVSTREVGRIVHLTIRFPEEMRGGRRLRRGAIRYQLCMN